MSPGESLSSVDITLSVTSTSDGKQRVSDMADSGLARQGGHDNALQAATRRDLFPPAGGSKMRSRQLVATAWRWPGVLEVAHGVGALVGRSEASRAERAECDPEVAIQGASGADPRGYCGDCPLRGAPVPDRLMQFHGYLPAGAMRIESAPPKRAGVCNSHRNGQCALGRIRRSGGGGQVVGPLLQSN